MVLNLSDSCLSIFSFCSINNWHSWGINIFNLNVDRLVVDVSIIFGLLIVNCNMRELLTGQFSTSQDWISFIDWVLKFRLLFEGTDMCMTMNVVSWLMLIDNFFSSVILSSRGAMSCDNITIFRGWVSLKFLFITGWRRGPSRLIVLIFKKFVSRRCPIVIFSLLLIANVGFVLHLDASCNLGFDMIVSFRRLPYIFLIIASFFYWYNCLGYDRSSLSLPDFSFSYLPTLLELI